MSCPGNICSYFKNFSDYLVHYIFKMLATITSQHKSADTSLDIVKSKEFLTDSVECFSSLAQVDTTDNPIFLDNTERNIFQQMRSERNRLYSFQNKWPLPEITPQSLAEAGLFYLQNEDKVQCPFCYIILFNWTKEDKPLREHMRKSPRCPFLLGSESGNIPLIPEKYQPYLNPSSERKCLSHSVSVSYKPKHPRMADIRRRILTYCGWPLSEPEPQQLAECGLYYSGIGDVVTCFFCGGTLGNWDPNDNPWNEHSKFFPDCAFLASAKIKSSHSRKIELKQKEVNGLPSLDADIIEQALDIFPKNVVLEAVKRKNGMIHSLQDLCDDILELKKKQNEASSSVTVDETNLKTDDSSSSNIDALLCKLCMDREKGAVFQPCGHFVACWNCSNLISNCPVCRRPITHKIRTYIS